MFITGAGAGGFTGGGGRPGAGSEIPILRYENNNNIDTYNYLYETGNGINAQEEGDARGDGTQAQGKHIGKFYYVFRIEIIIISMFVGFVPGLLIANKFQLFFFIFRIFQLHST